MDGCYNGVALGITKLSCGNISMLVNTFLVIDADILKCDYIYC